MCLGATVTSYKWTKNTCNKTCKNRRISVKQTLNFEMLSAGKHCNITQIFQRLKRWHVQERKQKEQLRATFKYYWSQFFSIRSLLLSRFFNVCWRFLCDFFIIVLSSSFYTILSLILTSFFLLGFISLFEYFFFFCAICWKCKLNASKISVSSLVHFIILYYMYIILDLQQKQVHHWKEHEIHGLEAAWTFSIWFLFACDVFYVLEEWEYIQNSNRWMHPCMPHHAPACRAYKQTVILVPILDKSQIHLLKRSIKESLSTHTTTYMLHELIS
jgi:hypothetical protein